MTIPTASLLGFAAWTLALLLGSVGVYRWSHILTGREAITDFPPDRPHGSGWYRRAMRAHSNCLENLPVFTALIVVLAITGMTSPPIKALCLIILGARIFQSLTHVAFTETTTTVSLRFSFFFAQILAMLVIIGLIANNSLHGVGGTMTVNLQSRTVAEQLKPLSTTQGTDD